MAEQIPEDIMQAAREAFDEAMRYNTDHESEQAIARALLAERRRSQAVTVKPLEWHTTEDVTQNTTGICHYKIEHYPLGGFGVYLHGYLGLHGDPIETLAAAKTAAQSDYEDRIRAALSAGKESGE